MVLINPEGRVAAIFKPEEVLGSIPAINSKHLLDDYSKIIKLSN
jgi:protein SCO1/2